MTYTEALEKLYQRRRFGMRPGLERTQELLRAVGNPEQKFAAIHVAGTNGKGSTCAFAERILRESGRRTGLYTSPHLLRFTERVRIDGAEIEREKIADLIARVLVDAGDATFFEIVTVAAFAAFAEAGVEVAVVETGLGGRLDSTNVLPQPLCTTITGIGLEHTDILGKTTREIAREKGGIIKRGVPAVVACDDADALDELSHIAGEREAPLSLFGRDFLSPTEKLSLPGPHQARNAALAIESLRRASLLPSSDIVARALADTHWPGRLERIGDVLIDAAHNPDGIRALAAALPSLRDGRPLTIIFGAVTDKDAASMLALLQPLADRLILSAPASSRARDPKELAPLAPGAEVIPELRQAIAAATGQVLITGSIFLVGAVRQILLDEPADPMIVQDPL